MWRASPMLGTLMTSQSRAGIVMPSRMTFLEGLFPEPVRCVISADYPEQFELLPAEHRSTVPMIRKRRREFVHGRSCARFALAGLGYPDCAVPAGNDRAPIWPDGIVGSISHCGGSAAAAVARRADIDGIGLDIESNEDLDRRLVPMICRSDERTQLGDEDTRYLLAKLVFSAKESIFKCIWPQVRRFVDFQEVEIRLNLDAGTFSARPQSDDLPTASFRRLRGRFRRTGELLATAAYLVGGE